MAKLSCFPYHATPRHTHNQSYISHGAQNGLTINQSKAASLMMSCSPMDSNLLVFLARISLVIVVPVVFVLSLALALMRMLVSVLVPVLVHKSAALPVFGFGTIPATDTRFRVTCSTGFSAGSSFSIAKINGT